MQSTVTDTSLRVLAEACREAARAIAYADSKTKNCFLEKVAAYLIEDQAAILAANERDVEAGRARGLGAAMLDRLVLSPDRLAGIAAAVREVIALTDPVGEVVERWEQPNGLRVGRERIPLGVIAMIYESRPNVTIDAAVLCIKAGNGIILRGGSEAFRSNMALQKVLRRALHETGLPEAAVTLVPTTARAAMNALLTLDDLIDLVIPRGGEGLIRFVNQTSRIPVIKHYKGVCHLYVDRHANRDLAVKLLVDGKVSRPAVCNALETMLVHREIAHEFLPAAMNALTRHAVAVRGCPLTRTILPDTEPATEEDYHTEYLDLTLAVKVVDDYESAVGHIHRYGSDHTEVIVTQNEAAARRFTREILSSVVLVNASSRFSDGGQLGLGAEIGISTTKLHAYGPMGLKALTTKRFIVAGEGQVRHPDLK